MIFGIISLVFVFILLVAGLLFSASRIRIFKAVNILIGSIVYAFYWLRLKLTGVAIPAVWATFSARLARLANTVKWMIYGFMVIMACIILALLIGMVQQYSIVVTVAASILAFILSIVFLPVNATKLWFGLKPARSLGSLIHTLLLIIIIYANAQFLLGNVWGNFTLGVIVVVWMINILGALYGTSSNIPNVIMTVLAGLIVLFSGLAIAFQEDFRAVSAANAQRNKEKGLVNAQVELEAYRTFGKVTDTAVIWEIKPDPKNEDVFIRTPLMDGANYRVLKAGQKFRAKEATVSTVKKDGIYLEFILPIPGTEDEYPSPDPTKRYVIDMSKVELYGKNDPLKISNPLSVAETERDKKWKRVDSGSIQVTNKWSLVGTKYRGQVLIVMSGSAVLDPNRGSNSPCGINELAPLNFALPGYNQYSAVAKIGDGEPVMIGCEAELSLGDKPIALYIGPNEDISAKYGNGFADNNGKWNYDIYIPQEIDSEPKTKVEEIKGTGMTHSELSNPIN